ncbi:MAG TPA: UDP-N-acetylmuramyl-tripeptide synthetase [Anaerolineae bacterium]|nr:UDP-N-acetylmuramyl-tripeptide synthetase [Anaerolineae bacterium]
MTNPTNPTIKTLLNRWQNSPFAPPPPPYNGPDHTLTAIVEHTDAVTDGACFVARVRATSDGHSYIPAAISAGATLILGQHPLASLNLNLPPHTTYWQTPDTAATAAWLAAAWHNFPSQHLTLIGVTGTDGKTTTTNYLYHILKAADLRVGMISTIKAVFGDHEEPTGLHVTTPEAPIVQQYLRRMVDAGLTHCILETTSHGLAQHRVTGADFDISVVTNITHEHLDYHGDYQGYLNAKARLFRHLTPPNHPKNHHPDTFAKTAILNLDDESFSHLTTIDTPRQIVYAIHRAYEIDGWITPSVMGQGRYGLYATALQFDADKTRFNLHLPAVPPHLHRDGVPLLHPPTVTPIETSQVGEFNVHNMLAASAAAFALPDNITPDQIKRGLESVPQIDGRMERIDRGQPFLALVDFAHTPNALEKALAAARGMTDGRIIAIFGSAGKRDVAKRRLMAEVSAQHADITILTAEDPRTESLDDILQMMAEGCLKHGAIEGETFYRVPDRGQAIYHALTLAQPNDLVVTCGKGHEQSMAFGTTEYPWDDRHALTTALDAYLANQPMPDLGLPTFTPTPR